MATKLGNITKQITTICLMMLLFNCCVGQSKKKAFIAKYELEDFFQFKGVDMTFRGTDKHGNFIVFGYMPSLIDSSNVEYVVILDRENNKTIEIRVREEYYIDANTIKLQQLAQKFMKYEITRLRVDKKGNVFVYLIDFETLALVRFESENEMPKYPRKWINVKSNWYKPK